MLRKLALTTNPCEITFSRISFDKTRVRVVKPSGITETITLLGGHGQKYLTDIVVAIDRLHYNVKKCGLDLCYEYN